MILAATLFLLTSSIDCKEEMSTNVCIIILMSSVQCPMSTVHCLLIDRMKLYLYFVRFMDQYGELEEGALDGEEIEGALEGEGGRMEQLLQETLQERK